MSVFKQILYFMYLSLLLALPSYLRETEYLPQVLGLGEGGVSV